MRCNVAVVPAGQWGTALAIPLARRGHHVRLWIRSPEAAAEFQEHRENRRRLPGFIFPHNVEATANLQEAVADADLVIIASASVGLQETCAMLRPVLPQKSVVLSVIKAIFPEEPRFVSEFIAQQLAGEVQRSVDRQGPDMGVPDTRGADMGSVDGRAPDMRRRLAVLSGPNFALEIARGLPAGTVVAAQDGDVADFIQKIMMTERLRVWTSTDVIGVQLGGALKNIIAIGAGLSDGLGMGDNARAALVTRGVAEITRLGVALGANPLTFAGVSGIGDIMLTCTGDLSRNRGAGLAIARGTSPASFMTGADATGADARAVGATVEGIATTKAVHSWASQLRVEMPITAQIYRILYEGVEPEVGLHRLMTREATTELTDLAIPWSGDVSFESR